MRKELLGLMANQVLFQTLRNKAVLLLMGVIALLLVYAAYMGYRNVKQQNDARVAYHQQVRANWEAMPDKHPHRMAHYGYIAFRTSHPLSFFDFGMESYTGNAVFLEAHRQNTINYSEASLSTGLLRFGEISMAMVLQVLVPLFIFFLGFGTIAQERETGTLKLLLSQGVSWHELLTGKMLGVFTVALLAFLPVTVLCLSAWLLLNASGFGVDEGMRLLWIVLSYGFYFALCSAVAVIVSAICKTAKVALVTLIGIWLLFTVLLPRTTQAMGNFLYPSPSKIEFEAAVEQDLIKKGDSHDPNAPYFKALKDSVLKAHGVASVEQLPFNYSGFQMKEGEKLSSGIYNQHLDRLLNIYHHQNQVTRITAFINPFMALKNFSMAVSGTDYLSYLSFQQQAEAYRYRLAQHMNELQIKLISNKKLGEKDKPYAISNAYWKSFPDFTSQKISQAGVVRNEALSLAAFAVWLLALIVWIQWLSKTLNAL